MDTLGSDWSRFLSDGSVSSAVAASVAKVYPDPSPLHFSTQTFIAQLNRQVDLKELFWNVEIIPYDLHEPGICKKQMKFTSFSPKEVEDLIVRLDKHPLKQVHIIRTVNTIEKFKDIRKISIGLCKKDLTPNRVKQKGAFFNCLVLNVRISLGQAYFKDHHVKLFNTGNVEIPGIQDATHVPLILDVLERSVRRIHPIERVPETKIVLINSHFNLHFYVNRDRLYAILRQTYGIAAVYDSCSYPGVQCKLYYTLENEIVPRGLSDCSVSVMIFRTGSVLIVGKCNEQIIHTIFKFLNGIFKVHFDEVAEVFQGVQGKEPKKEKKIKKWILKK
jgi:TATA-box binding protein (TBP) (component of TFIID and TFIIIB)